MRSTRDKAVRKQINVEFEAVQFDVAEAAALLSRAIGNLNALQGKHIPPTPPVDAPANIKQRPINPDAVWLTVRQAAIVASVSVTTIWRWFNQGLPYSQPGGIGRRKIRREHLHKFMSK